MTLTNLAKAPFPWFGGKSKAGAAVWAALGDPGHYIEPFAGSMAVLLGRPGQANRPYFSETVNDADGLLVNAWRSIQMHPDATADAASNPVAEADLHARHSALVRWRAETELEHLMGDPSWCDPVMGGWWLWGVACWIGSGWCSGAGPWVVDDDDRLVNRKATGPGVNRQLPYIGNDGRGVNRPGTREPGTEPGVNRQLPQLSDNGEGVNHAGTREPGTEPGVNRKRPQLSNDGRGVNRPGTREPGTEHHPVTMPELRRWFAWLTARLRHVRILNGDWTRATTNGAVMNMSARKPGGYAGIFLDPPYADTATRADGLYAVDSLDVAHDVKQWCLDNAADPKKRIVLAGFDGEHGSDLADAGWTEIEWFKNGFLAGGMGNLGDGHQQNRERLWASPHCETGRQGELF